MKRDRSALTCRKPKEDKEFLRPCPTRRRKWNDICICIQISITRDLQQFVRQDEIQTMVIMRLRTAKAFDNAFTEIPMMAFQLFSLRVAVKMLDGS